MLDTFNAPKMKAYCDDLTAVPYHNVRFYNLHKPASVPELLDYRTWLIGIEYINNQPYLSALVTIISEP